MVSIYNYLYKFSLERLQHFLNNKCLMLLFVNYLKVNGFTRIHSSSNMVKYRHAYYEACNIMISQSSHRKLLGEFYQIDQILKVPDNIPALLVKATNSGKDKQAAESDDESVGSI